MWTTNYDSTSMILIVTSKASWSAVYRASYEKSLENTNSILILDKGFWSLTEEPWVNRKQ